MSKKILVVLVLVLGIVLAACGTAPEDIVGEFAVGEEPAAGAPVGGDDPAPEGAPDGEASPEQDGEREQPQAMGLMVGIFALENTGDALTAEQAAEMLPLWKALRSLGESETTAAEELEALVSQIAGVLTPAQAATIETSEFSFEEMGAIAEELGIELGGGQGRFGDLTPEMQATREAARESGQAPAGGFGGGPGGGPGGGGEGGLSPEARQTAIAERGGVRGARLGLNPAFLDAMIEFLEAKAGS